MPEIIPDGPLTSVKEPDEIGRLEAEVASKRQRVLSSIGELRRRVHGATNWRQYVEKYPLVWVVGGFSLGFLFGYRGHNHERRR